MNKFNFIETKWDILIELYSAYFDELEHKNEGFHCGLVFDGTPYLVHYMNDVVGFVSIGDSWDKGTMLRGFYVKPAKRRYSVQIFEATYSEFNIEAALVASNDSLLVGLAFEKMNELKTTFDIQAYNCTYGIPLREAEYGLEYMEEVLPNEYELLNVLTMKQWDEYLDNDTASFYKIVKDNETLGYGCLAMLTNSKTYVDVGNYTLPEHRRKGVGRSLIINLSKIANNKGFIPLAGCWHGNKESIRTLISSGYIPENRLFYIRFK